MGGSVMKDLGKRVGIVICLFFLGLMTLPSPGEATPMPSPGNNYGDMRSALKFLQDMDSYYGQIARPRFGKRSDPGVVMVPNPSEMYSYGGPGGGPVFIRGMPRYYGMA